MSRRGGAGEAGAIISQGDGQFLTEDLNPQLDRRGAGMLDGIMQHFLYCQTEMMADVGAHDQVRRVARQIQPTRNARCGEKTLREFRQIREQAFEQGRRI